LKREHGLSRIAYVDIDAHHGDGVFYAFEDDPALVFADTHEDGRFLYPGTGAANEIGTGAAIGRKLNLPLPPGAGDAEFLAAWPVIESHLERHAPEFVILQCGADSLAGDPITHLQLTEAAHAHAATRLCLIADRHASGRILGFGGRRIQPAQHRARLDPRGAGIRRSGLRPAHRVDFALRFRAQTRENPCSVPT